MLSVGSLRAGKIIDMRNVMAASAHMREMAGLWMDFTGLFFIVTWISSIAALLRLRYRVVTELRCRVVKVRQMLVISRDALPAIVSHAAADRLHTGCVAACDCIDHERRSR
jgi:hypothetical protein